MGGRVSVVNDFSYKIRVSLSTEDKLNGLVEVEGVTLESGKRKTIDCAEVSVHYSHILKVEWQDEAKSIRFGTLRNPAGLEITLLASEMVAEGFGTRFELITLARIVLPGLRLSSREILGTLYKRCFVSEELIAFLLLHRIAKDEGHAMGICQLLFKSGVILSLGCEKNFKASSKPFTINLEHEYVRSLGRVRRSLSEKKDQEIYKFVRKEAFDFEEEAYMEGWLDKKGFMGMYQRRYFRALPDGVSGDNFYTLAWFQNEHSIDQKGELNTRHIERVESSKDKLQIHVFLNQLKTKREVLSLRAPTSAIWQRWKAMLQSYAESLDPIDVLEKSAALSYILGDKEISFLAERLRIKEVKKGTWVAERGERIDDFHIITSGSLGIYLSARGAREAEYLTTRLPFESFGSTFTSSPNSARMVRTLEDTQFALLSHADITAFAKKFPKARGRLTEIFDAGLRKIVSASEIFKGLSLTHLSTLRLMLSYREYRAGQHVYSQGNRGYAMYLVFEGKLEGSIYDEKTREESVVRTLGPAETFGELSMVRPGEARTASIRAIEDSLVLELSAKALQSFCAQTKLSITNVLNKLFLQILLESQVPFFEHLSLDELQDLVKKYSVVRTFKTREVVFKQGDIGDKFYNIISGEVSVSSNGGKVLRKLGPRAYFGEIALVLDQNPRTATVTALSPLVLFTVDKKDFRRFFMSKPRAMATAELRIAGEKCKLSSIINHPRGRELFAKFLKKLEGNSVCLDYLSAVKLFRVWAIPFDLAEDIEPIQKRAQELVEKYFSEDCLPQLGLEKSLVDEIIEEVREGDSHAGMFAASESEVRKTVRMKHLEAFKTSPEFTQLMVWVEGYKFSQTVLGLKSSMSSLQSKQESRISTKCSLLPFPCTSLPDSRLSDGTELDLRSTAAQKNEGEGALASNV